MATRKLIHHEMLSALTTKNIPVKVASQYEPKSYTSSRAASPFEYQEDAERKLFLPADVKVDEGKTDPYNRTKISLLS